MGVLHGVPRVRACSPLSPTAGGQEPTVPQHPPARGMVPEELFPLGTRVTLGGTGSGAPCSVAAPLVAPGAAKERFSHHGVRLLGTRAACAGCQTEAAASRKLRKAGGGRLGNEGWRRKAGERRLAEEGWSCVCLAWRWASAGSASLSSKIYFRRNCNKSFSSHKYEKQFFY